MQKKVYKMWQYAIDKKKYPCYNQVSIDTEVVVLEKKEEVKIETKEAVETYIAKLKYVLKSGATINFQEERQVDKDKPIQYTNKYTIRDLFPDENPIDALRRELATLSVEEYLRTVKDIRYPSKSEMREFGKVYPGNKEVYIKIRVEVLGVGQVPLFVMSFHYAMKPFSQEVFPYKD